MGCHNLYNSEAACCSSLWLEKTKKHCLRPGTRTNLMAIDGGEPMAGLLNHDVSSEDWPLYELFEDDQTGNGLIDGQEWVNLVQTVDAPPYSMAANV